MRTLFKAGFIVVSGLILFACGGGSSVGSDISVDITTPSSTTSVAVDALIIATITDVNNVGITVPSSWSDVFTLRIVSNQTNLCTDGNITYNTSVIPHTVTCNPGVLLEMSQYALSISGLTDTNGNRIDPASIAFETGHI